MTQRRIAAVAAFCLIVLTTLASQRVRAANSNRLTGRGTAVLTVMSGGLTSRDATFTVNFTAVQDARGQWSGSVRLAPALGAVQVSVDGTDYVLERIGAEVFDGHVDFAAPSAYDVSGPATLEVTGPDRQTLFFPGKLKVSGSAGGRGAPIAFEMAVGSRGERGEIAGSGSWNGGGASADTLNGLPGSNNGSLKGFYSGELHGERGGNPFSAVLVIGFDGNGGITGGRISQAGAQRTIGPTQPLPPLDQSFYSVESDRFGVLSFIIAVDPNNPIGSDGLHRGQLAVADGGKIVKVALYSFQLLGPVPPVSETIIGELVRQ
jgi:hypothetical protein